MFNSISQVNHLWKLIKVDPKTRTIRFQNQGLKNEYHSFTTGVLSKDRIVKTLWTLVDNPGHTHWGWVDAYITGGNVQRGKYVNASNLINNKFIDEEVYGVSHGIYPNNLT